MKSFDYTNTQAKVETEEVQEVLDAVSSQKESTLISESMTMFEAIEQERKKALDRENERHKNITASINGKFDELTKIETERNLTIQKAIDKAQNDLQEIDELITERRTGIFDEVKEIAQEFNARFNPNTD